jgi:hypothetical protein
MISAGFHRRSCEKLFTSERARPDRWFRTPAPRRFQHVKIFTDPYQSRARSVLRRINSATSTTILNYSLI